MVMWYDIDRFQTDFVTSLKMEVYTMTKKITKSQVIKALEKLVQKVGEDHHYKAEQNTPHKEAMGHDYSYDDCIAGCVIRELAPEVHAAMLQFELVRGASFALFELDHYSVAETVQERFTVPALEALSTAQVKQDSGQTWALALKAAKGETT